MLFASPLLTITACRGVLVGPTGQGLSKLVLLQTLQSNSSNEQRHKTMASSSEMQLVLYLEWLFYRQGRPLAKLKIHYFHLTGEEWFRIKREVEQQTLVFLTTGHAHFWENQRTEECCHFLVVCLYSLKDNFTWIVWETDIRLHLRKYTSICRQVWKQKKSSSMADHLMPRSFCWAICLSRECSEASSTHTLMQSSYKPPIWTRF